jgi:hypothetical protein
MISLHLLIDQFLHFINLESRIFKILIEFLMDVRIVLLCIFIIVLQERMLESFSCCYTRIRVKPNHLA